jgi:uncharacterized protein (DUF2141 family)
MQLFITLFINLFIPGLCSINSERAEAMVQQIEGIELIITNIRNKTGLIQIGLYNSDKGYPDKPEVSFSFVKDSLISGKLRLFLPLKNPGTFAITILDDENRNKKMDYRFGIMPKEGFGFSNNPKIRGMKEPPFSETSFTYIGGKKIVTVSMIYI